MAWIETIDTDGTGYQRQVATRDHDGGPYMMPGCDHPSLEEAARCGTCKAYCDTITRQSSDQAPTLPDVPS